jgi:hypothetical protein
MITAWNQFLFYRMLYGTASATGLEADALAIPEVVPNRTDGIARAAQLFGYLTVLLVLMAIALRDSPLDRSLLGVAFTTTSLAVGLGLGAAFSPTLRRGEALRGVAVGAVGFLMALLSGRVL